MSEFEGQTDAEALAWLQVRDALGAIGLSDPEKVEALRDDPERLSEVAGALLRFAYVSGAEEKTRADESPAERRYRWDALMEDGGIYPLNVLEEMRNVALTGIGGSEPATYNARTFIGITLGFETDKWKLDRLNLTQEQAEAFSEKLLYEYFRQRGRAMSLSLYALSCDELRMYVKGASGVQIQQALNSTSPKSATQFRVRLRKKLEKAQGVQALHDDFRRYLTPRQWTSFMSSTPELSIIRDSGEQTA